MADIFPTRQYPYRQGASASMQVSHLGHGPVLEADTLHRFIVGLDDAAGLDRPPIPRPLVQAEADALDDRFGRLLRQGGQHPLTARALVAALDATGMARQSFVVGEGLQIPWTPANAQLARQLRIVVAWKHNNDLAVLLSTAPPLDDRRIFLQVIGWDENARHFNYYERRLDAWIFAGNSSHALTEPTRGRGPFDSHVNGALVMKELKSPWLHWSSMAAFDLPGVAPNDALLDEPLFAQRDGAEELETLVRTSIARWTTARLDAAMAGDMPGSGASLLRHLLTSTTLNLVSSAQESTLSPQGGRLRLPITPFLDANLLLDELRIEIAVDSLSAPWEHYRKALDVHGYELRDEDGRLAQQGDTHFAFPAFERALEDQKIIAGLLQRGVLSRRLVACLAMVDFPNPVWSNGRETLMAYIPETFARGPQGWDLGDRIVSAIQGADARPASPEAQFMELWNVGENWVADFGARIDRYLRALQLRLDTWEGFEAVARLIASQRRRARKHSLLEFSLTLPCVTKLPDANLRMTTEAIIEEF